MNIHLYNLCKITAAVLLITLSACETTSDRDNIAQPQTLERVDIITHAALNGRLLDYSGDLYHAVNIKVYNGRVLITGHVATQEMKEAAIKIAQDTDGVKEVIEVLKIGSGRYIGGYMSDLTIASQVTFGIFADGNTVSGQYKVDVLDGVVYLIGESQTAQERQDVINMARSISGVKEVVSYIEITHNN